MSSRIKIRRHKLLPFVVCVAALGGLAMTPLASGVSRASAKVARDLSALFSDRSPGERADGALVNLKASKSAKSPQQVAAPKTDDIPRVFYFAAPPSEFDPGPIADLSTGLLPLDGMQPGQSGFMVPQPRGFVVAQDGVVPPVPSAVPEPAMWVNFIVGFGLVGSQLRRRKKKSAARTA